MCAAKVASTGPLEASALDALGLALQDEYAAEKLYRQVLDQFGEVRPFSHIVNAEQRHSAALERVYVRRGLVAPENTGRELSQEPQWKTLQEACQVAVDAERDNVALYEELLGRDLPADVVRTFEHLRDASLERHLPAFERCATGEYVAEGGRRGGHQGCCGGCARKGAGRSGR
jgi:rubrerythrin